ncbi:phospholipase A2 A2-actitoxin-Cgg2a-like [Lethenteron reissneri]|uniref:phospholipase A2 A2-actitoxin-Cgg2a-like n=1 Tax=Lethenteron reissneri TaxID=7753 RepID=UPI002AB67CEF|nr:phospholipase A2 A2-actitoxin-Cgg2a-like [Lethenteron reissneri]
MARMLAIAAIALASVYLASGQEVDNHKHKRSSWNFAWMIYRVTGRNPLDYSGYGCHCILGSEGHPVDAVDKCCQVHNRCYDAAFSMGCAPHLDSYEFSTRGKAITCRKQGSPCETLACSCDKAAVECFAIHDFDDNFQNFKRNGVCDN